MLDFSLSKQQAMVKKEVANLVKSIVTDSAHEMDENKTIPASTIQKAWELGISIAGVPEEYGGYGMEPSPIENVIVLEELAFGDMAFAIAATLPSVFISPVTAFGTDAQKKKYLPQYCTTTYTPGTLALCEPHFNSDPVMLKTTAEKKNGSYLLNGRKCFVPLAAKADHLLVAAVCDGKNDLFIVSKDNPGMKTGQRENNLGLCALETHEVTFDQCVIPAEDRLGGADGCDYNLFLQKTRVAMSALGTGVARASYEFAKAYARQRTQFGEPIASRQSVAFMIAQMAYEVDAMRLLTFKAASCLEAGKNAAKASYLAKLYTGDMAMTIVDNGVQILGGHGYIRDFPVERYYRNGRSIANLEGLAIV